MVEEWLRKNVVAPINEAGIEVQEDAFAVLLLACTNQLRSGSVSSEEELYELVSAMTPHLVAAYRFKYGDTPMTFGRGVRLLADVAERVKELRTELAGTATASA